MNELQIFSNARFGEVRVAERGGEPMFCLADVCKILELGNPSQVKTRLCGGVISNEVISDSLGRTQNATFINEDGLYDVILDSRKPEAKAFRKWVTSEVLPTIRKHGAYMTQDVIERTLSDPDYLIQLATQIKDERQKRIEAEHKSSILQSVNDVMRPKALFADAVATSSRSCLIGELAKVLQQNGVSIGQNRLFDWLRKHRYLCERGESYNKPTQKAMELGLFEIKTTTINKPDGTILVSTTTKCTGKGQIYFINKFLTKMSTADMVVN